MKNSIKRVLGGSVFATNLAGFFLRNVAVDQPGAEGVAPLVRGQPDRAAMRVTDIAEGQPAIEREPVGR